MAQRQLEDAYDGAWRAPGHGRPGTPRPTSTTSGEGQVSSTGQTVTPVRLRRVRPQPPMEVTAEEEEAEYQVAEVEYPPSLAPAPVRRPLPVRPAVLPPTVARPRAFRPVALAPPARQQLREHQGRVGRAPRPTRMPAVRPWWGAAPMGLPVMLISLGFERRCPGCGWVVYVGGLGTVLPCPACGFEY